MEHFREKGRLIILSAPSGGGKTTMIEKWLQLRPEVKRSISYTTRSPRPSEQNGIEYHFIPRADFLRKRRQGFFLEWARVFDYFYGTSKTFCFQAIEKGLDVILAIDVQGMRKIMRRFSRRLPIVTIFVMPPSERVLKERLLKRKTDSKSEIEKRLRFAKDEMKARHEYNCVIINRNLKEAVRRLDRFLYVK
ncbi:MAG: guanylate kinase [Candidatus Omnitrophica bacterium]|nr:guanylate kinase [Candidatus Omnitrophota bacterium]